MDSETVSKSPQFNVLFKRVAMVMSLHSNIKPKTHAKPMLYDWPKIYSICLTLDTVAYLTNTHWESLSGHYDLCI